MVLALLDDFPVGWRVFIDLVELVINSSDGKGTERGAFHFNKYKFLSDGLTNISKYFFSSKRLLLYEKKSTPYNNKRMANQAHLNKLFNDGVHKDDYTAHKDWF